MVMGAIRPRWFLAGECGVPRMKEQEKTKEGLGKWGRKKLDPYCPSLTHVQVLLSNITCSPSYPICAVLSHIVVSNSLGSSVHGILQARILEWVAISFSRGSSQPRD